MSGDHNMYCSANQPDTGKQATPHRTLMEQLMDSRIPKTEREYAALQEIERLRRELEQAEETEEELIAQRMSDVADRFAHRLALDLECILPHYSGPWYGDAMRTLEAYRAAMRDIHEDSCPTHMGEPVEENTP